MKLEDNDCENRKVYLIIKPRLHIIVTNKSRGKNRAWNEIWLTAVQFRHMDIAQVCIFSDREEAAVRERSILPEL